MRKICIAIVAIVALPFISCQNSNKNPANIEEDSVMVVSDDEKSAAIVNSFFQEFQKNNDAWMKTTEGQNKLVKAFEEKMTTDVEFAKACASYNTHSHYDMGFPVRDSGTISAYDKADGEEGEIKAFDMVISIDLIKPLYNGQKEIRVKYEIISTIPSTVEEHWRPYVDNVNYCSKFNTFLKNKYDATLDLGCYIVTKNDKK